MNKTILYRYISAIGNKIHHCNYTTPTNKYICSLNKVLNAPNMANISTPIPQLKLNDGTSIPMLAYGSESSLSTFSHASNASQLGLPGTRPIKVA